jgi:nucleotide-binding universal stress UspA family protein
VLLTIERNEAAHAAAEAAYSLAETFERPLYLLHARTPAEVTAFLNPFAKQIEDFGVRATGNVAVHYLVKDGNPADAAERAVAQHHPSILVIGVKRASHTPGPHGTAFALLARSRVPVLCVPPELEQAEAEQELAVGAQA